VYFVCFRDLRVPNPFYLLSPGSPYEPPRCAFLTLKPGEKCGIIQPGSTLAHQKEKADANCRSKDWVETGHNGSFLSLADGGEPWRA